MATVTHAAKALRAEVEAAVLAEVVRVGQDAVNRRKVLQPFLDAGGKQSTLYRWLNEILASGRLAEASAKAIVDAAAARASRTPDPAKAAALEVAALLPTLPKIEHIASAGAIPVTEQLNTCMEVARELMRHARTEDGRVRNGRQLLAASEHLRRCLETAARITDTLHRAEKVERFHQAIIEEIARESPIVAERILTGLSQLVAAWGNP